MYVLFFTILTLVVVLSIFILASFLLKAIMSEVLEVDTPSENLTEYQKQEYEMVKRWYLENTSITPSEKKYTDGRYDNTIDYIITQKMLSKNSNNISDFRDIMRGVGPSSKVRKINPKEDSSDGMPIFNS